MAKYNGYGEFDDSTKTPRGTRGKTHCTLPKKPKVVATPPNRDVVTITSGNTTFYVNDTCKPTYVVVPHNTNHSGGITKWTGDTCCDRKQVTQVFR